MSTAVCDPSVVRSRKPRHHSDQSLVKTIRLSLFEKPFILPNNQTMRSESVDSQTCFLCVASIVLHRRILYLLELIATRQELLSSIGRNRRESLRAPNDCAAASGHLRRII